MSKNAFVLKKKFRTTLAAAGSVFVMTASLSLPTFAAPLVADAGCVVNLQGEASRTVPNDEAVITFTVETQKRDAAIANEDASKKTNATIAALRALTGESPAETIAIQTTDLSTWPVYAKAKDGEVATVGAWGARQTIRVTVKDVSRVSEVLKAGIVNGGADAMQFGGISFGVSKATRQAVDDVLLKDAVADASARAIAAAEALGLSEKNVRIESVTVGGYTQPAVRYYAAPKLTADAVNARAAAPEISAGSAELSLRVTMQVRLLPD